jgi:hypothetical protein
MEFTTWTPSFLNIACRTTTNLARTDSLKKLLVNKMIVNANALVM